MVDERELKAIVQMLSTTAKMAEQIRMTSGLEDQQSSSSAAQQYNAVVKRLENTDTIPRDMFLQLEEGASLQDVGISSGQLAAYLTGLIEQPDEDRKDKEGAYHRVDSPEINIFGTTPDMQKLIETIEKLELRLDTLEKDIKTGDKKWDKTSPKVVTTEDLEVPAEWGVDPLKTIPSDPESIVVLMKWLQHLIDKCGRANLSNILDYYVDIGWITQDAKISLIDYSQGITEEGNKGQDPSSTKKIWDLPSRDHIQSLIYIQKLKGIQVDKHFIDRIDGELTRLTKKLDNYTFK